MSSYDLNITRTINAPRQAVWDAWTKPELFSQWYMPKPFSVPKCELDAQTGGQLKLDTMGPDGMVMPLVGIYRVVEEPGKLVLTNSPLDKEGNKLFEIQHTLLLTESGDSTNLDLSSEVLSEGANAEQFLSGMKAGLEQALDQLAELVTS